MRIPDRSQFVRGITAWRYSCLILKRLIKIGICGKPAHFTHLLWISSFLQKFFCKIDLFHVRELLNFFPVIGEDEDGEMIALDAAKVLSIPRKIKSKEVVRRGFMSDFLFQNISNV